MTDDYYFNDDTHRRDRRDSDKEVEEVSRAGDNKTPGTAEHECQRCGSDEWTWCDYRGCSNCFEPDRGDNKTLPERLRAPKPADEIVGRANVARAGWPTALELEAAVALEAADETNKSLHATWKATERELAEEKERAVARVEAVERERDDLGPLFVRDACRVLGVAEDDPYRLDKVMARLSEAVAAEARVVALTDALQRLMDAVYVLDLSDKWTRDHSAPGELIACTRPVETWTELADAFHAADAAVLASSVKQEQGEEGK